ncbi:MAG TPA: sialidase family protein [Acidobacteriaceae bacterium]|nr:sialidase family protein [Acidobacteriaceae bacterium]
MKELDRWVVAAALAAGAVGLAAQTAATLPMAPGAQVTTLSAQPGTWSEPGVAVNPRNPQQVLAVFQYVAQAGYSNDAGRTWKLAQGVAAANYRMSGDVSATFDDHGHALICFISFDKLGTVNYWAHGATRNGIFVRRSLDGGATWEPQLRTVVAQPTTPGIPFEDKPYIVADTGEKSPYKGNLYIGWTRWTLTDSRMLFSRSTDDGVSWSNPQEIAQVRGLPRDDNGALEGFDGAVGPDGVLYAVWAVTDHIVFTESDDGGKTFAKTRNIAHTAPTMFALAGMERANGFPQIAVDSRTGPGGGAIYVTWSDYRNGDLDVFCIVSRDHGRTWSAPVRVNNDPVHDGADQFFQWLAVDPVSGAVNVAFYDRRADAADKLQGMALARSTDGGATFRNYAWTKTPFDPAGVFMGDYIGLAASGGRVYGAWTTRTGKEQKTSVELGVADFGNEQGRLVQAPDKFSQ